MKHATSADQPLPNIIYFTWHDAGDWFGCYGHSTVQTPHVDRLAAEGRLIIIVPRAQSVLHPGQL